ncbi:hypothetical protein MAPG_09826 [Magnaporthiopsis poae ATCC 64411]|uniref:Zn(2)-C6 fungal-type domain-containing protein n=1 Tax=Magnaporthiopsis poae (strain ATCC 64411 / 73-15) TaxID=644358 RepID=A0A0C4EAY9_MAGP6|nr:hypothetical protein MAPG_09826 [Magnaporthiopsis poae ATCC 64411]
MSAPSPEPTSPVAVAGGPGPASGPGPAASPSSAAATATARPPKRTSNTCLTCRARKVRCDGRRDVCTNCERLGFGCTYHDALTARSSADSAMQGHGASGTASPTPPGATTPQASGSRNRNSNSHHNNHPHNSNHSGADDRMSDRSHTPPSDHADGNSITSPSNFGSGHEHASAVAEEVLESMAPRAFENFFRHVHHVAVFSFLHRASLMQRYHAGLIDRGLLLALVGITSLLTDLGPGTREYGAKCVDEAEASVLRELDKPSTLKLQTLVLIIRHRILNRRFPSAFMLHAIASRFAVALRLNHENPRLCFLAQESRRRLMWSVYMIDTSMAAGHSDFGLWEPRPSSIRIQLPCNERNFDFDLAEVTEPLEQPLAGPGGMPPPPVSENIGFLALQIRVHLLRSRILQYTKSMINNPNPTPEQVASLPARFAELESQLGAFAARLPVSFGWSEANVRLRAYSPRLCVFLMTHVLWEQCHLDLYRVAAHAGVSRDASSVLPRAVMVQIEASHPGFVGICRRQIFEHARAMADMFSLLLTLEGGGGVPVADLDLPLSVFQCARMLFLSLHTSGADFGITSESVAEMGNVCLRVLKQAMTAPAAVAIRADLEKLLETGIPSDLVPPPNTTDTPEPTGLGQQLAHPANPGATPNTILARHGLGPMPGYATPVTASPRPMPTAGGAGLTGFAHMSAGFNPGLHTTIASPSPFLAGAAPAQTPQQQQQQQQQQQLDGQSPAHGSQGPPSPQRSNAYQDEEFNFNISQYDPSMPWSDLFSGGGVEFPT